MNTNKLSLIFWFVILLASCSDKESSNMIVLSGSHWECKDTVWYDGSPKVIYCSYALSFEGSNFRYEAEETTKLLEDVSDTTYTFTGEYAYNHPDLSLTSNTFSATSIVTEKEIICKPDSTNRRLHFKRIQ